MVYGPDSFARSQLYESRYYTTVSTTLALSLSSGTFRGIERGPFDQEPARMSALQQVDVEASRQAAREKIRNLRAGIGESHVLAAEKQAMLRHIEELETKLDLLSEIERREQNRKRVMEPAGRSIDLSEDEENNG